MTDFKNDWLILEITDPENTTMKFCVPREWFTDHVRNTLLDWINPEKREENSAPKKNAIIYSIVSDMEAYVMEAKVGTEWKADGKIITDRLVLRHTG